MSKFKRKNSVWSDIKILFSGWELAFQLAILFALNFGMFYIISGHKEVSLVIGIVGSLFFFRVFVYENKKLKQYQYNLKELFKYVQNMIFLLGFGEVILHSMLQVKENVNKAVQRDIDKTVEILRKDARLDTSHFRKYGFSALDQFHQNLAIQYDRGGDSEKLYSSVHHAMMVELKKRDELYRKRKGFAGSMYFLCSLILILAVVLRFHPYLSELWNIFINFNFVGIGVLVVVYLSTLFILYLLQKQTIDISVRL